MADSAQPLLSSESPDVLNKRIINQGYTLVLGSSSVWRKRNLANLGFQFETASPDIDEKAIRDESPDVMTVKVARAKADALLPRFSDRKVLLLCSDQVILCNNVVREKPVDVAQAKEFLQSYGTHPATAVDGVVVVNTATGKRVEGVARATQHFKPMPDEFIQKLIDQGDVLWCAGGFTVEHMTEYTAQLEGEPETIEGLPRTLTLQLIAETLLP